jgi:hypothetical protein
VLHTLDARRKNLPTGECDAFLRAAPPAAPLSGYAE